LKERNNFELMNRKWNQMKISRAFVLATVALAAGFFAARWCTAQSSNLASVETPKPDSYIVSHQLESFISYLQANKQTEVLRRFNNLMAANSASQNISDLMGTLAVLENLREGHTNQVYELLEGRMDNDITDFASSYRQLPPPLQAQINLMALEYAKDYRGKYPHIHPDDPNMDKGVANAFKILGDK